VLHLLEDRADAPGQLHLAGVGVEARALEHAHGAEGLDEARDAKVGALSDPSLDLRHDHPPSTPDAVSSLGP